MRERKRRRRLLLGTRPTAAIVTAVMLVTLAIILSSLFPGRRSYDFSETTLYIVESGDTLWGIAEAHSTNRQDTRKVVEILRQLNGVTADIRPGQCLFVPVFAGEG